MNRSVELTVDTFANLWAQRRPDEANENEIIARLLAEASLPKAADSVPKNGAPLMIDKPSSSRWVDILVWALQKLGGKGHLSEIYPLAAQARRQFGLPITRHHDASARERLETHCRESKNYKGGPVLFWMPEGKGSGVWALK